MKTECNFSDWKQFSLNQDDWNMKVSTDNCLVSFYIINFLEILLENLSQEWW